MEDHIQVSHMVGMDYKCHTGMERETDVRARVSVSFVSFMESYKNYKGEISNTIQQRHFHRIFEIRLTQTCSKITLFQNQVVLCFGDISAASDSAQGTSEGELQVVKCDIPVHVSPFLKLLQNH